MVGISLLTLVPGVVGGSETYARELLRALARMGELDYVVFTTSIVANAQIQDLTPASTSGSGLEIRRIRSYRSARTMPGRTAAMARAALFPGPIRRELELERLDAIHFPLTAMLPLVDHPGAVTTMHDLQHEVYPRFFSRAELLYRRIVYRRTAQASRLVIAPSEYVKGTLVDQLGLAPERVRVAYHGIDHTLFAPAERERRPFLLYPANRWPHKNHQRLFEALALLRRRRPELRLVLTGSGHDGKPVPTGVDVRGRVAPEALVELYRTAAALVFPSLYEGFGAPPLEAMACGCPVAASDVCSVPELLGDAAVFFDPGSAESIADGVERALEDDGLPARGLAHAAAFTGEACARAHEEVYREAITAFSARAGLA
jgi:glycosyltransferase involved in cell wall biosynthesis